MVHLSALSFFPNFNPSEAKKFARLIVEVITDLLILLSLNFPNVFHNMHHRNKEIITIRIK
jgi:hypothetical protein